MASDLDTKIIKQFEYYFGDYNLPRDKFLKEETSVDDGWVEVKTFLKFPRLLQLTSDAEVIISALKKAENDLICLSEDGQKIRRNPDKPVPELTDERRQEITNRTAYAKGFPFDETLDNILTFLEEYGPLDSCYKRTFYSKATKEQKFKGSCFIVFKNLEECKKFVEADSIKYKETELLRKFQKDYIEGKKKEYETKRNEKKGKKQEKAEESKPVFPKKAILFFSGVTGEQVLTREEIKDKVTEVNEAEPAFIDYKKGDKEGYIRMSNEDGAVEFCNKLTDGTMEIGDSKLHFKVLEGEEEEKYLQKTTDIMIKRRQIQKKGKKSFKRKFGHDDRASKKIKT